MAESADPQVRAFHQLIENGDLEQLRAALAGDVAVNAPGHCGATALMVAIAAQDLEKVRLLLEAGADPELTDDFNRTALHVAVQHDFAGAVRLLLNLGVDRGYAPKYPLKQVLLDFPWKPAPLPDEMKGCFTEEEWLESQRATQESIRDLGLHPAVEPVIKDASSLAVLHLLLEAGDDLNLASQEMKRALVGLDTNETIECSEQDYRQHKTRRFGRRNPERMDNPFWRGMIRSGGSGYTARSQFGDTESLDEPVWCFDRFGSSLTPLPDGRFVQIAGEHEDYYDPDFCIYNDVVVHDGRGDFEIYGYPAEVFPPTDFHTATLVGDWIYIVGSLGYADQRRVGHTPVYRLRLDTWEIESVTTTGEAPGWIFKHTTTWLPESETLLVTGGEVHVINSHGEADVAANTQTFALNLRTLTWRKQA